MSEPSKADCCGAECTGHTEDSPCEGSCTVVDEQCNEDFSDCYWIHLCEKHAKEQGY